MENLCDFLDKCFAGDAFTNIFPKKPIDTKTLKHKKCTFQTTKFTSSIFRSIVSVVVRFDIEMYFYLE